MAMQPVCEAARDALIVQGTAPSTPPSPWAAQGRLQAKSTLYERLKREGADDGQECLVDFERKAMDYEAAHGAPAVQEPGADAGGAKRRRAWEESVLEEELEEQRRAHVRRLLGEVCAETARAREQVLRMRQQKRAKDLRRLEMLKERRKLKQEGLVQEEQDTLLEKLYDAIANQVLGLGPASRPHAPGLWFKRVMHPPAPPSRRRLAFGMAGPVRANHSFAEGGTDVAPQWAAPLPNPGVGCSVCPHGKRCQAGHSEMQWVCQKGEGTSWARCIIAGTQVTISKAVTPAGGGVRANKSLCAYNGPLTCGSLIRISFLGGSGVGGSKERPFTPPSCPPPLVSPARCSCTQPSPRGMDRWRVEGCCKRGVLGMGTASGSLWRGGRIQRNLCLRVRRTRVCRISRSSLRWPVPPCVPMPIPTDVLPAFSHRQVGGSQTRAPGPSL